MRFKVIAVALAIALAVESAYIVIRRHPTDRFKPIEEFGYGIVALDTATGQICKTLRTGPPASQRPTSSSDTLPGQPSGDPVIDEIKINRIGDKADDDATADFVRKLPACVDIR